MTEKFNYHRAVFPIEIPYRLIRMYSYLGDTILDPYMGTGATMIAADKCNRMSIGFENDPRCDEWIRHRLQYELLPLPEEPPKYEIIKELQNEG